MVCYLKKYINWVIYLDEDVGYPHLQQNLECLEKPGKKAQWTFVLVYVDALWQRRTWSALSLLIW